MRLTLTFISISAISIGGIMSALTARQPSRLKNWISAYLVLVVGVLQLGLVISLDLMESAHNLYIWLNFAVYNIANLCVISGTAYKSNKSLRILVDIGGGLLALSMVIFLILSWGASLSLSLVIFYLTILTILISMPVGLVLSRRRK